MVNCSFDADNIIPLVINGGGIGLSIIAIAAMISHGKVEQSLRGIFISFLVANILAGAVFCYDIVTFACSFHAKALNFIFKVFMIFFLSAFILTKSNLCGYSRIS